MFFVILSCVISTNFPLNTAPVGKLRFVGLKKETLKGYRTLCFAMRILELEEYKKWVQEFEKASISIDKRAEKLAECAERIETNLTLVGASAIEDKLQQVFFA